MRKKLNCIDGRLILAGGFAVAIAVAPALAAFAGPTASPAPRVVTQETDCGEGLTMEPGTDVCVPEVAPGGTAAQGGLVATPGDVGGGGAPSEQQLTEDNPGVASPTHGGGGDHG